VNSLIELLRIPSPKHHRRGNIGYRHHGSPQGIFLRPFFAHCNSRQASSSPTESRHRRALLITDPVRHGNSLSTVLLYNQGYPKVCPDSLHLLNVSDSVGRNIIVIFLFFVFPDQGLNYFDLESSRVFSVKSLGPSLLQISELLHFIEFRKKFIKMQNKFCLNP
jgi:hypothetical protein